MSYSNIEWTEWVENPVWGCTGSCPWCYARKIAKRFGKRVCARDDFAPTWIESNYLKPIPARVRRVFVNSMSDLADWETEWVARMMTKIGQYPDKQFYFLTKRPKDCEWEPLPNAWLGISITQQKDVEKHPNCRPLFLSIEPLLGPVELPKHWHPRWIIIGAETGNRRGKVVPEPGWIKLIYDFARNNEIPLFLKDSLRTVPLGECYGFPQEYPE